MKAGYGGNIYQHYEKASGTVNQKPYYISKDKKFMLQYCGTQWYLGPNDELNLGECRGYVAADQDNVCPSDIGFTWEYLLHAVRRWLPAKKGFGVWCEP